MEELCVRIGLYTFTQVTPFGSVFVGTRWQFPLLLQSSLISILMIPAAVMIYRDDTGRTVAEKLARRAKILPTRPVLGSFVVMLVGVNLAFMTYGVVYTAVTRWSGAATSVVCPWPWPSARVYDPQGFYERNGAPGPFSEGIWSRWESAQPDGRPVVQAPPDGGRCKPRP
jgi:Spirocyclase AveC-like